jgi:hypothetical protein
MKGSNKKSWENKKKQRTKKEGKKREIIVEIYYNSWSSLSCATIISLAHLAFFNLIYFYFYFYFYLMWSKWNMVQNLIN